MPKKYIEQEAAKARLRIWITDCVLEGDNDAADCYRDCIDLLDSIPAADVAEVVHGQKLRPRRRSSKCCCDDSTCNGGVIRNTNQRYPNGLYPICPHCGAKLDIKRCLRRNSDDANIRRYY